MTSDSDVSVHGDPMNGNGKKDTISDTIYNDILEAVGNGTYAVGERLPSENVLKDRYGVSRNTIRLVLNRLCALGVVETRRGDGSFVRGVGSNMTLNMLAPQLLFESHNAVNILELRKAVEVYAVRLAAMRATEEDIVRIRSSLKQMQKSMHDIARFEKADTEMHLQIARATGNEMFGSIMEIIHQVLAKEMTTLFLNQDQNKDSYFYHNAILDCIELHKPDEASYLMEKHISMVIERVKTGGQQ